jgi:electron transport complex protein RnfD
MNGFLFVSPAPHVRGRVSTAGIMRDVLIALAPAAVASAVIFGTRALAVIGVCAAACVFFEWGFERVLKRPDTSRDLSACVTGVLLAFNLPVSIPLWQAVLGSFVAIVLIKQLFGGIGKNFANPAITARIVLFLAFSGTMTHWVSEAPRLVTASGVDAVSGATPLTLLSAGERLSNWTLFLGDHGGSLGETCAAALLLGFVYLLIRRVITFETPVVYIGVVFLLSAAFGWNPVSAVLSGGLLLGAIFMATDYTTSPMTFWGRVIFGAGAGFLTVIIRVYGSYPEGVSYSILLMNILTPYINKLTEHKPLGGNRA